MNSACPIRSDDLAALAMGMLDERDAAAVEAHIASCPRCATNLAHVRATVSMLDLADPDSLSRAPAPSPELAERVFSALAEERPPARRAPRAIRWALAASVAVLATALGIGIATRHDTTGGGEAPIALAVSPTASEGLVVEATLTQKAWGTAVRLVVTGSDPEVVYRVWLADGAGERIPAGTFRGVDHRLEVSVASAMARPDAAEIGVSTDSSDPIASSQVGDPPPL